jgi:hypothetical protein
MENELLNKALNSHAKKYTLGDEKLREESKNNDKLPLLRSDQKGLTIE